MATEILEQVSLTDIPALERRFSSCEVRAKRETSGIEGYAAVFDSWSVDLGGFREIIRPDAFAPALENKPDIRALVDHDPGRIIGRTAAKTLWVSQDDDGLAYLIDVPDTRVGRDILTSIERGDVTGSSFSFRLTPDGDLWSIDRDGTLVRELVRIGVVYDVGPVTFPAYPDTSAVKRSLGTIRAALERSGSPMSTVSIARLRLEIARRR